MAEPKTTLYTLPTNAQVFLAIPATIVCRYVRIREDESGTAVGLEYQLPNDGFAQAFVVGTPSGPNIPQIELGSLVALQDGAGSLLGAPAQNAANGTTAFNYQAATTLIKLRSHGAGATKVRVEEYS